jgi:hypothetical protein
VRCEEENLALAEVERGFGGLKEAGLVVCDDGEAVLNDVNERQTLNVEF